MRPAALDKPLFHLSLIVLLGLVVYSGTFNAPFHFDDFHNIVENRYITDLSNIPAMFAGLKGAWASRPMLQSTVAINFHFGGLDPRGYHIVNLAIHIGNGILLYVLVVMTGRRLGHAAEGVRFVALFSSLLFVAHPLHTEAVISAVNRSMLLATTFYLLGLTLFLKAVEAEKRRGLYIGGLFVAALMGMASREDFSTFPVVLFLYDLFFISRFRLFNRKISPLPSFSKRGITSLWKREAGRDFQENSRPHCEVVDETVAGHWRAYLPVILSLGYMAHLALNNTYDSALVKGIPPLEYALTQFNVHAAYLRLLLLPVNQSVDYDYAIAEALFEFPTIIAFAGYLGLWAAGVLYAKRRPVAAFGALWFLVTLLPVSFGVAFLDLRLGDVIFEHRAYLPSVALFPAFVAGVLYAVERAGTRKPLLAAAICVAVVILLSLAAYERAGAWRSQRTLWEDAVRKSPNKARVHSNLGNAYLDTGVYGEAIEHYEVALRLRPSASEPVGDFNYAKVHYNLGKSYGADGQTDTAIGHYKTSMALNPWDPRPHFNLGVIYLSRGLMAEARAEFEAVLRMDPGDGEARAFFNYISRLKGGNADTGKAP